MKRVGVWPGPEIRRSALRAELRASYGWRLPREGGLLCRALRPHAPLSCGRAFGGGSGKQVVWLDVFHIRPLGLPLVKWLTRADAWLSKFPP